jgi:vacuolar protein sorting-associated protein 13A/C
MGITHGVGGLVSKPLQEAEKGGVGGFFKGAAMGLAGLITKPVIGVIDLTTKTAEGIKNNTSTKHQSAKPERVRMIRAFYGFN